MNNIHNAFRKRQRSDEDLKNLRNPHMQDYFISVEDAEEMRDGIRIASCVMHWLYDKEKILSWT